MSKIYKFNKVLKKVPKVVITNSNGFHGSDKKIINDSNVDVAEIQIKEVEKKAAGLLSEAFKKTTDILQQAKNDAEHIIEDARKKAESIYKNAYEEGYSKGIEDGKKEGLLHYQTKVEEIIQTQKKLFNNYKNKILKTEKELVELSIQITEKVIRKRIKEEEFIDLINYGLKKFTNKESLIIRVCPDFYHKLEQNKNILYDYVENLANIDIINDHSLKKGDCIIESLSGKLDAGISGQLKEIKRGLLGTNLC